MLEIYSWSLVYCSVCTDIEEIEAIPVGKCSIRIGTHIMTIVDIRDNVIHKVLINPNRVQST